MLQRHLRDWTARCPRTVAWRHGEGNAFGDPLGCQRPLTLGLHIAEGPAGSASVCSALVRGRASRQDAVGMQVLVGVHVMSNDGVVGCLGSGGLPAWQSQYLLAWHLLSGPGQ
ncbi:unnamed protein product [Rangifer tarandus platyrhynchus]|uniref:Uncharacterized protein n=1 Tax=Rangifer tarandus platyrhynchus TaxID=3082113 RepID=A0ABN8YZZ3_RANTA|nr:unnamed protein product [Rangifer tarandus platyrhynchus]